MTTANQINIIKEDIEELNKNYKRKIDNLKRSEQQLEDSKYTYNHFFYYTMSISVGILYLTRFIYKSYSKK